MVLIMKKRGLKLFSVFISLMMFVCNIQVVHANEGTYTHSDSATSGGVTLNVEWNEPVLGQAITFHVSATGGSGHYKFNMEAPSYTNPDTLSYESVADPSRGEWTKYTEECSSQDYTFTMMASGTYNFRFHVMDIEAGVTYLRTNTYIQVSSPDFPSVNSIVQSAVNKCNSETDGSDYAKALWLHDWLLEQLDYDNALKWSSAESALTRGLGTCQAYERAYSKLLTAAGIENAETRDTYDGHTWNAMKIDGKWYQVDCTWDDSNENYYDFNRTHLYFGLSDELMAIAHQGHKNIYTAQGYSTSSISLDSNYFVQSGDAQKWADLYKGRIQENLNAGHTEFSLTADNATYPPSIYGIQNGIIAYAINKIDWFVNGKKVNLVVKTNDKQFDFTATYSNVDSEAPVIDVNSIKFSKNIATVGDTVTISVKITDNVGITSSVIILKNTETGKMILSPNLVYNEKNGLYEYSLNIDDEIPNGQWCIDGIQARDAADNLGIRSFFGNTYSFKVYGSKVDSEAPVIDVNSIKFSKNIATVGDTVTISVKITDNVGITSSVIILKNTETGKMILSPNLVYNEKNGLYEYSLNIDDEIPNGQWCIDGIQARDAADNLGIRSFFGNTYSFNVYGSKVDSEAPVIDVNSVKFSKDSATEGDTLKISLKIKDNVEVTRSVIILKNYETEKRFFLSNLIHRDNGLYECYLKIDDEVPNGHWYIEGIQAYDAANNLGIISGSPSDFSFTVTRNNKDVHKWDSGTVLKQPTCAKEGETVFECSVCHKTKTEVIKALGHDYSSEWTIDKEATCTESGSKSHHCSRCDSKKDVTEIAKKGHNWDSGVVTSEATCTHDGVKTYTCKDCKVTKNEVIKALGHDYSSEWTIDKEATCTESGSKSHHCSRCDSKKDVTEITKKDHNWDDGVVTTEATCTHDGVKTYTCKDCKTTKTEVIKALGHNYSSEWTIDKEATCTESGSKSHHCLRCDSKKDVTEIAKKDHNWNSGVVTTKATCTHDGVKTYTCKDCKTTKTEVIKALGHEYSSEWTIDKEATCTESGSKSHHCLRCDSKKDVTEIAKKDHNWNSGVVTTKAICTHDGVKTYTCKDCKVTKTEVIKALGHDYSSEWTIDKDATCTESGSKSHHCSRCDSKKDVTEIAKKGHDWVVESSDSVHSGKDKEVIYRCSHCKEIRKDVVTGSWQNNSNGIMYLYSDGSYENSGFKVIDNKTYYFQNNGVVKTDWLLKDNVWYYFNKDGIMQTGWNGPGRQFYFDDGGKMLEKQFTPDGYYVGSSGAYVRNGWVLENGQYYYMNSAGRMVKSAWVGAYYLDSNGVMVTNSWVNNYWCGNDGAYVKNKWIQWHGNYYYLDSNGIYVRNKWIGAYYLGSNGAMAANCWVGNYWCGSDGKYVKNAWVDNNRYYVGSNGLYVPGKWQKDSKGWWYQAGNTYAKNITLNIGGTSYTFDSNGYMA